MDLIKISAADAKHLIDRHESHFWDQKSATSSGGAIQKIGVALANADGGEFIVGIEDRKVGQGLDRWRGFATIEDSNKVIEAIARDVSPAVPYGLDYVQVAGEEDRGIACLVRVHKSVSVHYTAANDVYVRRGSSSVRIDGQAITDLTLAKGARSYEDQLLDRYTVDDLVGEDELASFLMSYSPATEPADFARKQGLVDKTSGGARVAASVLYAAVPPAVMPKRCSIKVARYNTRVDAPKREHLGGTPLTIEGPARVVIEEALRSVTAMVEAVSVLQPDGSMVPMKYPPEALKEIIVNAVIHRDYNISDDVLIYVFDNRVEVRSPGVLPGHMTLKNLLSERFSRNPTIVRLLNKYPDPPNKDIGEGLRTARDQMLAARLKEPTFKVDGSYFVATLGHTPLARPQEIVMEYLASHDEITNSIARSLTGIASENSMKEVFYSLRDAGKIEMHPDRRGNKSSWRKLTASEPSSADEVHGSSVRTAGHRMKVGHRRKQPRRTARVGRAPARNEPCPCGSGVKYKRCHGASTAHDESSE